MKLLAFIAALLVGLVSLEAARPLVTQQRVSFEWDPYDASQVQYIRGFRLCWGSLVNGRVKIEHAVFVPGPLTTSWSFNLDARDGVVYVVYAVAVGVNGLESVPSNVVTWMYLPSIRNSHPKTGYTSMPEVDIVLNRPPLYPPPPVQYPGNQGTAE